MKLDFHYDQDDKYHQYCFGCKNESIKRVYKGDNTYYLCTSCGQTYERSIVIDPAIKWWVDKSNEYWHESSGVFVRGQNQKFLFFDRTIFPFALTVPSGHVDADESTDVSASRELMEEVSITTSSLTKIAEEDIKGDSCRRGSDVHKWHAYLCELGKDNEAEIEVKEEGVNPVWLTLEEALDKELTYPVKYVIKKHYDKLLERTDTSRL